MGFNASQFLQERGESAIGSLLAQDTRRVETQTPPTPGPEPTPDEPAINPLRALYNRITAGAAADVGQADRADQGQAAANPKHPYGYDEAADQAYIPLTEEEMAASAESKTEMWGAVIAMVVCGLKSWSAKMHLKPGDKKRIDEHERQRRTTGGIPVYPPNHPYHAARDRYDEFERLMDEAENESALREGQMKLLYRAIHADIKEKNNRKRYKTAGIYGTVGEIFVGKMAESSLAILVNQITRMSQ